MYTGFCQVTNEELADFYEGKTDLNLYPNQFVLTEDNKILKYKNGSLITVKAKQVKNNYMGKVKSLNTEQTMALDLLFDDSIKLVVLSGKAGCGKTYLSTQVGLQYITDRSYDNIFFIRNNVEITKGLGALPGEKLDKLKPYMASVVDQVGGWNVMYDLLERRMIEAEALGYIQGRSIADSWIIADEAQNLTKSQMKMLITRVSHNSKIVLCGDIEQVANGSFEGENNGIKHLVECFKGYSIFGTVMLQKGERSELAELASVLL